MQIMKNNFFLPYFRGYLVVPYFPEFAMFFQHNEAPTEIEIALDVPVGPDDGLTRPTNGSFEPRASPVGLAAGVCTDAKDYFDFSIF